MSFSRRAQIRPLQDGSPCVVSRYFQVSHYVRCPFYEGSQTSLVKQCVDLIDETMIAMCVCADF